MALGLDGAKIECDRCSDATVIELMIHSLARFFRGMHMALGVTTLPPNATPEQERKFVLVWLALVAFFAIWVAILFFWITS